jgi:iron complex outermembrane receptor protein
MKEGTIIGLFVLFSAFAFAGKTVNDKADTAIHMAAVTVTSDRLQSFGLGNSIQTIDTLQMIYQQSGSLVDVLQNESAVFLRTYGLGGLATVSVRGTASVHTAILWDGFNLQSPMNSLYDLALIPAFFLDHIDIQYGSSGALFGSSAMGGSIHLGSKTSFNNAMQARYAASYGSFNNWMQGAAIAWSTDKWYTNTRFFYHQSENNFKFRNLAEYGKPLQRLSNAALQQYGVLHEQGIRFSKDSARKNQLSFRLWCQHNERGIPPAMTVRESQQQQTDGIWRITATYQHSHGRWETIFRNAYFNEKITFRDPSVNLSDDYNAHTVIAEWENKIRLGARHMIHAGSNYTFNRAYSKNYVGHYPMMQRGALFFSYRYTAPSEKIKAVASIRQEIINRQLTPIIPSVASEYRPLQWIALKASISANFRVPNFNDWYWNLGGNPELKSEKGWAQEAGILVERKEKNFLIKTECTAFSNLINNRIIWLPNDIGIWTPENVSRVWSRGIEAMAAYEYQHERITIRITTRYQFTKATNESTNDKTNEAGKQLIYTPLHRALFQFGISYRNTSLQYIHQLNGKFYYTSDNTKSLPFYHVANLIVAHHFRLKQHVFHFFGKINNLFNTVYQVIAWRPMPLLHFEAGLQFSFNHKNPKP